jgi:hypothetical protein
VQGSNEETDLGARVEEIDALLEVGQFDDARQLLQPSPQDGDFVVLRLKLALYEGKLSLHAAMQALVQLIRDQPASEAARRLYDYASKRAFQTGISSVSHSHPPPARGTGD